MKPGKNREKTENVFKLLDSSKAESFQNFQHEREIYKDPPENTRNPRDIIQTAKVKIDSKALESTSSSGLSKSVFSADLSKENKKEHLLVSKKIRNYSKSENRPQCAKCTSSLNLIKIAKIKDLFSSIKSLLSLNDCPLLFLANMKSLHPFVETPVKSVFFCEICCIILCCQREKAFISWIKLTFKVNLKQTKSINESVFVLNTEDFAFLPGEKHLTKIENLLLGYKRAYKDYDLTQQLKNVNENLKKKYRRRANLVSDVTPVLLTLADKLRRVAETSDSNTLLKWVNNQILRFDCLTAKINGKPRVEMKSSFTSKLDIQTMISQLNEIS